MLNDHDQDWLVDQLAATAELLGQQMSPTAAMMLAEDLAEYSRPVLSSALKRVRTECAGKLTPKVIIEAIDAAMGRPGSNEAWATALSALDERNTVVWTEEMAQAWEVARPVVVGGDEIGGRMAFKDAYERLVRAAREERRTPVVTVSMGQDANLRAVGIERAVKLGYLAPKDDREMSTLIREAQVGYLRPEDAAAYLPAPKASAIEPMLLLAENFTPSPDMPTAVREKLLALRNELATAKLRHAEAMARRAADAAADLIARKAQAQTMADEYTALIDEAAALRRAEWAAVGVAA